MNGHDVSMSRPIACARALGEKAADAHRFVDKRVLLTGDEAVLATKNGKLVLLDSLRLLVRISRFVDVWLPQVNRELRREVSSLGGRIQFTEPIAYVDDPPDYGRYDAILCVGVTARSDVPWTVVNSNGWLARVSSSGTSIRGECRQTNPIGALAAASLGVSEVFKRLLRLKPDRGPQFGDLRFSSYTLSTDSDDPGPVLRETIVLPTTLVAGQGAIGNGIVLLLTQLPLAGTVWLLDRQKYGPENLGTCVMLEAAGIGEPKAEWNARRFFVAEKLRAKPIVSEFDDALPVFGESFPYPSIVLGALDNVATRHAVQDLWPDLVVDGAIGDLACQVVTHSWDEGQACLKCLFTEPPATDPFLLASRETGLSTERVAHAEDSVTQNDVEQAPPEKREQLRTQIGRKICSVVSEALADSMSVNRSKGGFSPSVPFVATMSATLVIAAFAKRLLDRSVPLARRFYFDLLQGPHHGEQLNEQPKATCTCQTRRSLIQRWRQGRTSSAAASLSGISNSA